MDKRTIVFNPASGVAASLASLLSMLIMLSPGPAYGAAESVAHGVPNYGGTGQCYGTNLNNADNEAYAFMDATKSIGYDAYYWWWGTAVDSVDFNDMGSDESSPGGTDWADVIFFSGHGLSPYCPASPLSARYSGLKMGDSSGDCNVYLGGSANQVVLGGGDSGADANFLMMHASRTLAYCAAQSGNIVFNVDGNGSGFQFTLLNGFHNSPLNETANTDEVYDFVAAAEDDGVGDLWGDIFQEGGGYARECSVSSITSSSESNADNLYFYGGFKGAVSTGSHTQHWYYSDCSRYYCSNGSDPLPWC